MPFLVLEIFVGFIQALVFALLEGVEGVVVPEPRRRVLGACTARGHRRVGLTPAGLLEHRQRVVLVGHQVGQVGGIVAQDGEPDVLGGDLLFPSEPPAFGGGLDEAVLF